MAVVERLFWRWWRVRPRGEVLMGHVSGHLHRSRRDRAVFGVCGGLAEYFGIDSSVVRLAFVLITLAGGAGVLAYIILAIVVPEEVVDPNAPPAKHAWEPAELGPARGPILGGVLLIFLGLVFLLGNLGWLRWLHWEVLWPLLLIALGIAILLGRSRSD